MSADVEYSVIFECKEGPLLNFIKHNRKLINAEKMKGDRVALFEKLLETGEKFKRVNQYM